MELVHHVDQVGEALVLPVLIHVASLGQFLDALPVSQLGSLAGGGGQVDIMCMTTVPLLMQTEGYMYN